jgi:hypothetical protein
MIRKTFNEETKKFTSTRAKGYIHYSESLKYLILKKIYMVTASKLAAGEALTLEDFKKYSAYIIEKEIATNKRRMDKGVEHYEEIKQKIIQELPEHFELLNIYDFENSIKNAFITKVDLKEYLKKIVSKLRKHILPSIPSLEQEGSPLLQMEIMSVNLTKDNLDIVTTLMMDIDKDYIHRNFLVSILFNYFYYFMKDEIINFFGTEKYTIRSVIIYNPLTLKRTNISFEDIKGTLVEMDLFRILKTFIENYSARTLDTRNCKFCENKRLCTSRVASRHKHIMVNFENLQAANSVMELM